MKRVWGSTSVGVKMIQFSSVFSDTVTWGEDCRARSTVGERS